MYIKALTVGLFEENCYVIGDETSGFGAVIDPGDEAMRIVETMRHSGLTFTHILNTHAHIDHVMAVQEIKTAMGIPFFLHEADVALLKNLPKQASMFGLHVSEVPTVDAFLADGGTIKIGGLDVEVIHTPGHTPGGVSFYIRSESVLFAGDTLFNGSIGRTDLYGGDFNTLITSIRTRLLPLPDEVMVYPGHGPQTALGQERRTNPFLQQDAYLA